MTTYYSTFTSGLQDVVNNALSQLLSDVKIDLLLDGLVIYRSNKPIQFIEQIQFFNNTFLLLYLFKDLGKNSVAFMMDTILKKPQSIRIPGWALKNSISFRIMASEENQTIAVNKDTLARLEAFFSHRLRLKVNRSKPDVEVWFLKRSEGYGFVGIRITRKTANQKNLQKGELKPELANILCLIAEPRNGIVFLDPFAGSGAIPIEWARNFPYTEVIASDSSKEVVNQLRDKVSELGFRLTVERWDAQNLNAVKDGSIDRIVTDPPWGIYTSQGTKVLEKLYFETLMEFSRILKNSGVLVMLTGQKDVFERILKDVPEMVLTNKYDILVSGKKAAVYKIRKQKH